MDIIPSNLPGTLIAKVLDIGPAAPEKDVIRRIIEKSLCIQASEQQSAMSGFMRMSPSYFQDILVVLPQYLCTDIFRTPLWIEHKTYDVARYLDTELWNDSLSSAETGYCFFTPEDRLGVVGIITCASYGECNPGAIDNFVKDGISILPYIAYINVEDLAQSVRSIRPNRLDLAMGHLHHPGILDNLLEAETLLMDTIEVTEVSGIIKDAAFLNGWDDTEKQSYCETSLKGAMHSVFRAVSFLICTQTPGIQNGIPGRFAYKQKNGERELIWKRNRFKKTIPLQYPIITPEVTEQTHL